MANVTLKLNGQEVSAGDTTNSVLTIDVLALPVAIKKYLDGVITLYIKLAPTNTGTFKFNVGAATDSSSLTSFAYSAGDTIPIMVYNVSELNWKQSVAADKMGITIAP